MKNYIDCQNFVPVYAILKSPCPPLKKGERFSPTALAMAGKTIPNDVPAIPAPTRMPVDVFNIQGLSTPEVSTMPRV